MNNHKKIISLACVISVIASLVLSVIPSSAAEIKGPNVPIVSNSNSSDGGKYSYVLTLDVYNPCNSNDMDSDAVNDFYFDFTYVTNNGFGEEKNYRFDMSWSNGSNNNSSTLWKHFIRSNDDGFETDLPVTLSGKLKKVHILLNMDGGERLGFTVNSIKCNGKRINDTTDWVSSAYQDSEANIYCSMEKSVIDMDNSSYFKDMEDVSQKELDRIIISAANSPNGPLGSQYDNAFKDQYNAIIGKKYLDKCTMGSDGDINQYYSHHDEQSMYKYTLYFNVENPINMNDADYDEVETFYLKFTYIDDNGYGKEKEYTLDMSYDSGLGRNKNPNYLAHFQRYNEDEYNTHFDVWVPGIVTKVTSTLNMSGDRLTAKIEKIALNSIAVNTDREYVSSVYFNSSLEVPCEVPDAQIVDLSAKAPVDQYNSPASKNLIEKAKKDPLNYIYHKV